MDSGSDDYMLETALLKVWSTERLQWLMWSTTRCKSMHQRH